MEGRDAHMEASQAEDHVPLPCSEDLYLPRRTVVLGLAWGRGIPQCPDDTRVPRESVLGLGWALTFSSSYLLEN